MGNYVESQAKKGRNTKLLPLRIPDDLFNYIDKRSKALGISRNEYSITALKRYLLRKR